MTTKITSLDLIFEGWHLKMKVSDNVEIWQRDRQLLAWNSETLKIYKII